VRDVGLAGNLAQPLKVARYSQSLQRLGRVLRHERDELVITGLAGSVLLVCAASLMYFGEREAQPHGDAHDRRLRRHLSS
jgi:hypothetical protein